jgi:acyl dehydratase
MRYAEDYPKGERCYLGEHKVTADEIIQFGRTYDPQPYHVDEELGRSSIFGGLIASGWNTCAIWMKLYVTTLLPDSAVEGSPGVDNIRFLLPVRPGDVLHGTAEITGVIPSFSDPRVLILQNKGELIRADGETALTLTLSSRFRKRGSGVETVT